MSKPLFQTKCAVRHHQAHDPLPSPQSIPNAPKSKTRFLIPVGPASCLVPPSSDLLGSGSNLTTFPSVTPSTTPSASSTTISLATSAACLSTSPSTGTTLPTLPPPPLL